MYKNSALLLIIALAGIASSEAGAGTGATEGVARFVVGLHSSSRLDAAGCWILTAEAISAKHSWSTSGTLRLVVGSGATVVEGETEARVYPARGSRIHLKLRKGVDGPLRILGSLSIPDDKSSSYDYTDTVMDLDLRGDSVVIVDRRIGKAIAFRDGQRFRYGGEYLVAIEDDESEPPKEFLSRATVTQSRDVICHGCEGADTMLVPILVTVGRNGNVIWIRPGRLDGRRTDDRMWAAISAGVKEWGFRPAMSPRGPVADYAVLNVRVISSK